MNRKVLGAVVAVHLLVPQAFARAVEEPEFGAPLPFDSLFEELAQATPAPSTTQANEPQPIPVPAAPASEPSSPSTQPAQPEPTTPSEPPPTDPAEEFTDEVSIGEIPAVETTELTPDMAKRAIDVYAVVKDKYKDAEIEAYENLQDFVDKTPQGKLFETDIKAAGFANVNDWNLAITTASFAYTNIIDDQTDDIKQQIEEIKQDGEMAQDMKDRMINSLNSMIPSDNNKKIVEDLIKDPAYAEKVKLLEVEEE